MVPSSPYAPCRAGKTTSMSASARGPSAGSSTIRPWPVGSAGRTTAAPAPAVISGRRRSVMASCCRVTARSAPTGRLLVMPTGTTSYSSGSRALMMLPALTQEIACSVLRPPKTTATRVFRGLVTRVTLLCVAAARADSPGIRSRRPAPARVPGMRRRLLRLRSGRLFRSARPRPGALGRAGTSRGPGAAWARVTVVGDLDHRNPGVQCGSGHRRPTAITLTRCRPARTMPSAVNAPAIRSAASRLVAPTT